MYAACFVLKFALQLKTKFQNKKDRQRAYNVTLKHVRATIMAVEKQ
jgi:hypothetical protein